LSLKWIGPDGPVYDEERPPANLIEDAPDIHADGTHAHDYRPTDDELDDSEAGPAWSDIMHEILNYDNNGQEKSKKR
jgi:hypothetical protein